METVDGKIEIRVGDAAVEVLYSGEYRIAPPFRQQDLVEWRAVASVGERDFRMGSTLICTLPRDADRKVVAAPATVTIVRLIERSVARRVANELQRPAVTPVAE